VAPALALAGFEIPPGRTTRLEIPLGRLFTQQMLRLPVLVAHGHEPGPRVWVTAAIHGDEINGTEIARRALVRIDPEHLRGTLVVVPVANVWGFLGLSRYLPDRRDLNRSFPGSPTGSLAAQIAHLIQQEIVAPSTWGIDLHAGSLHRRNLPQVRGDFENPQVRVMAAAFAAPAAVHAKLRPGSIREAASRLGIPCLLYEAGSTLRFEEDAIRMGTAGVLRVLKHLGMLDRAPTSLQASFLSRQTHWVRANRAGIFHSAVELGRPVRAGERVGMIRDAFGDVTARVRSRYEGLVIGTTENPLVNRGDAVVHVAQAWED
jgi:predicted deacylase